MKRENNLDFTPLLDVIMILLFIVLAGIGHKAQETKDDLTKAEKQIAELEENSLRLEESIRELESHNNDLTVELDAVSQHYNDLLAITEYGKTNLNAYPAVLRRVMKSTLVCEPVPEEWSDNWNVKVDLYIDKTYDNDLVYADSFKLVHDYDLTAEERQRINARQEQEMTQFLEKHLEVDASEYCYITIQYPELDENFSSLDLDIIEKAINNTQNDRGLKCYIERAGIF